MPSPVYPTPLIIRPPADLRQRQPGLWQASQALARRYAANFAVSEADLMQIGQQLWHAVALDAESTQAFDRARQQAGAQVLSILIDSQEAAIQQLPWEILYHPAYGFLGKANGFTLARRTQVSPAQSPAPAALEPGPLRVLLFTALPDDVDAESARLDVEEEQAQVLEALAPWIEEGVVTLEMPDDGRFSTLQRYLKEFQPHLLFLSGHGKFVHQPHSQATPYAQFFFEGETDGSNPVAEESLARAFLGSAVGCVVVSACESSMTASDALTTGLVWQLS